MAAGQSTVLYWFSSSGNSLVVAKALSEALGKVDVVPVAQALRQDRRPARVVGVVFPVYAFGLPNIVRRFLAHVPLEADPYVFVVATPGAIPGSVHRQAEAVLERRGVPLAAGWTVLMPESFSPVRIRLTTHRTRTLLRRLSGRIDEIARSVQEREVGVRQDSLAPIAWPLAAVHRAAERFFPTGDRTFRVADHCASCGLCARVCPVANIRLDNDRPTWAGHCEWCFACMQWCPVGAIRTTGLATNRLRYHHPDIRAEQIAAQTLTDDAAPSGAEP